LREIAQLNETEVEQVIDTAINTPDMANMPFIVTTDMLLNAIQRVDRLAG
jgi:hypothetical protein